MMSWTSEGPRALSNVCGRGADPSSAWRRGTVRLLAVALAIVGMAFMVSPASPAGAASSNQTMRETPLLAYYYIWFDPGSWDRAKRDYPLLGRYSSDDAQVMRQHIRWAKEAGITGWIVSWKSTDRLNQRLAQLVEIASEEGFKLAIIYQGLDFERDPLPVNKIQADLEYFTAMYATHPVFDIYGKPLVIWSGTWKFSREEVAGVVRGQDRVFLLASEKNIQGYERLADLVDGDAYYWSSVNPDTYPNYPNKLVEMGQAVHAHGGLWIAPAAPGFDARLLDGSRVVERADGAMLRRQMEGALQSSPDAIGLISWNEFSENSHVEPSEVYGSTALEVLAAIQGRAFATTLIDRGSPTAVHLRYGLPLLAGMVLVFSLSLVAIGRRASTRAQVRSA